MEVRNEDNDYTIKWHGIRVGRELSTV
jgi:hypothetical protein